jgi:cytochrome P450
VDAHASTSAETAWRTADAITEDQITEDQITEDRITEDWCARHFDYLSPTLSAHLDETLDEMREHHPVAYSDAHGGYWFVTRYEDVLRIAQDWRSFSNAEGLSIPPTSHKPVVPTIPESSDPPLHTEYKRLINAYFTPRVVVEYEQAARDLVTRLIDDFIELGRCDFMDAFARPFPGLLFFDQVLHAPAGEVAEINEWATTASMPTSPNAMESWRRMFDWITAFVEQRRRQPARGDVVDAILAARIEGRPVTQEEVIGLIQLLVLGGLETTAGALGHFVIRFTREPEIPELLRSKPELVPDAVEELLRLEGPFIHVARSVVRDAEVGGWQIKKGDRLIISWAAANRDEAEFPCPARFDLNRKSNRHLAFGAGPHRCAGSSLARMNLRIALEELVRRLHDIRLEPGVEPLPFHSAFNRSPLTLPITFRPGARVGAPPAPR